MIAVGEGHDPPGQVGSLPDLVRRNSRRLPLSFRGAKPRGNLLVDCSFSYCVPGDCHGLRPRNDVVTLGRCFFPGWVLFRAGREGHDPPLRGLTECRFFDDLKTPEAGWLRGLVVRRFSVVPCCTGAYTAGGSGPSGPAAPGGCPARRSRPGPAG